MHMDKHGDSGPAEASGASGISRPAWNRSGCAGGADDAWRRRAKGGMALAAAVLLLAACGTRQRVDGDNLALAATQIDTARSAGADEYAAVELNQARSKLDQARALAQAGQHEKARRLLDEAEADAQLARAKAATERSTRALAEVEAGLRALRQQSGMNETPAVQ